MKSKNKVDIAIQTDESQNHQTSESVANKQFKPVSWTRADDPLAFMQNERQLPDKLDIETRKTQFSEIYQQAAAELIAQQSARCLDCGTPYCEWQCPLHNYIPNWLEHAAKGQWVKAAEISHETNSFPEVCGRVCPQDRLCEGACTLNEDFGAVTIGNIEKFITEQAMANGWNPYQAKPIDPNLQTKRVNIVGAGPAGLACADVLVKSGVEVHVYDRHPEIGGLLMFGIPEFKLEKSVMTKRRQMMEQAGVQFHLNCHVGTDVSFDELHQSSDAVFLGTGAYTALDGALQGRELPNVIQALSYLIGNTNQVHQFNAKHDAYIDCKNKRVLVLGGGDTAMDCVRTAIRQGAESVTCAYRGSLTDMPGSAKEQVHAQEEGVNFEFEVQPLAIKQAENGALVVDMIGTKKRFCETSQRTITEHLAGTESHIETDVVILAFGFRPSPDAWIKDHDIALNENGTIRVADTQMMQTSVERVFAGGDNVNGADLVVTAIAQGRDAANAMIEAFQEQHIQSSISAKVS